MTILRGGSSIINTVQPFLSPFSRQGAEVFLGCVCSPSSKGRPLVSSWLCESPNFYMISPELMWKAFTIPYLLVPLCHDPLPGKVNQVEQLLLDPAQGVLGRRWQGLVVHRGGCSILIVRIILNSTTEPCPNFWWWSSCNFLPLVLAQSSTSEQFLVELAKASPLAEVLEKGLFC